MMSENVERKNKKYGDITSPLFNTVYKEYESAFARGRSIDSRAGIFLTFLFTCFPLYIQIIGMDYLYALLHLSCFKFKDVVIILMFFISIVMFLLAFVFFIKTLATRRYLSFNNLLLSDFDLVYYEDSDATINDMNTSLMALFHEYIDHNCKQVEKKAKFFDISLWLCFAYNAVVVILIILKLI